MNPGRNLNINLIRRLIGSGFYFEGLMLPGNGSMLDFFEVQIPGEPIGIGARVTFVNGQFYANTVTILPGRNRLPRTVQVTFNIRNVANFELSFVLGVDGNTITGSITTRHGCQEQIERFTACRVDPMDLAVPMPVVPMPVVPAVPAANAPDAPQ